jgi:hypothetical protein
MMTFGFAVGEASAAASYIMGVSVGWDRVHISAKVNYQYNNNKDINLDARKNFFSSRGGKRLFF